MTDVSKDSRILVAEVALERLKHIFQHKVVKFAMRFDFQHAVRKTEVAAAALMAAKYSYEPPAAVAVSEKMQEMIKEVEELKSMHAESSAAQVSKQKTSGKKHEEESSMFAHREMKWIFDILLGLPRRLSGGHDDDPAYAVDVFAVEVLNVKKHPESAKLKMTPCRDGVKNWDIITNIQNIKRGEKRLVAYLPPSRIVGMPSYAMFVSDKLPQKTGLGDYNIERSEEANKNVRSQVVGLFKNH